MIKTIKQIEDKLAIRKTKKTKNNESKDNNESENNKKNNKKEETIKENKENENKNPDIKITEEDNEDIKTDLYLKLKNIKNSKLFFHHYHI